MTSRGIRSLFVSGALFLGVSMPVLSAAPTVWLATVWIDDDPGRMVASDGLGAYVDYRIGPSLFGQTNYCVEASPTNQLLFVRLNRPLSDPQYCGQTAPSRQFLLTIGTLSACNELRDHGYLATPSTGSPCTITGVEKPRIGINSDLYAKQTTKTFVTFHTAPYDVNLTSYEVRTETAADVTKIGSDPQTRIVQYPGNGRLYRFEPGVSGLAVADAFPLPFQMTVKRQLAQ